MKIFRPGNITYRMSSPHCGMVSLLSRPAYPVSEFTEEQIQQGMVAFTHSGTLQTYSGTLQTYSGTLHTYSGTQHNIQVPYKHSQVPYKHIQVFSAKTCPVFYLKLSV